MELRYRRKMKMPVWSLPGFEIGKVGTSQSNYTSNSYNPYQDNWRNGIGNTPQLDTSMPTLSDAYRSQQSNSGLGTLGEMQNRIDGAQTQTTLQNYIRTGKVQGFGDWRPQVDSYGNLTDHTTGIKAISGNQWASIGQNAIAFGGAVANSFGNVKHQGELMADAGQGTGYGAGFTYDRQNMIDEAAENRELSKENTANTLKTTSAGIGLGASIGAGVGVAAGAGLGSVAGPIGAAAGAILGLGFGLIGSAARRRRLKRRIYNAQQNVTRMNNYALSSAQTDYMTRDYYNQYGDTQGQQLYSAREGKNSGEPIMPPTTTKAKVREFNRKLTLPNIKENNDIQ